VLTGVRDILRSKGIVVFTVEALGQIPTTPMSTSYASYTLQPSGRIAHNHQYITTVIQEVGLKLEKLSPATPRKDRGVPVQGYLVVARKP